MLVKVRTSNKFESYVTLINHSSHRQNDFWQLSFKVGCNLYLSKINIENQEDE